MPVEIPDIDALRKYLEDKNLTLVMDRQQEQPHRVLMPFQWKWEDIEPAVLASGKLVRLAKNEQDLSGVARRDTHFHNPRNSRNANFPLRLGKVRGAWRAGLLAPT